MGKFPVGSWGLNGVDRVLSGWWRKRMECGGLPVGGYGGGWFGSGGLIEFQAGKNSMFRGGARGGGGSSIPIARRNEEITSGWVMTAMMRLFPPHRSHRWKWKP